MTAFERDLGGGLVLRTVRDEADIQAYVALHSAVVSRAEGLTCDRLLRYHPGTTYDDYWVVEDTRARAVVSTTCLLPWRYDCAGVALRAAQLEMVVTLPGYRRRGLVRAQVQRFHEVVAERAFDLSIIEGIPYYYRQYGYAYAVDHWPHDSLLARHVPDNPDRPDVYTWRPAAPDDAPLLARLYAAGQAGLDLYTLRDAEHWRFLLGPLAYPVWLLVAPGGAVAGYVMMTGAAGAAQVHVFEAGAGTLDVGLAMLRELKRRGYGEIRLGGPAAGTLQRLARSLGSTSLPCDQWLVRLADVPGFLRKLRPAFAARLAASAAAGLSARLVINLFRRAFVLSFEGGRLVQVDDAGFLDASIGADGGDLCIPPDAFVRLALGYRDLDALRDAWPDIVVKPASRYVVETLFPRLAAHLSMPYFYAGPPESPPASEV